MRIIIIKSDIVKEVKLKIGEIAKLCNVSNRTLRFYEELGLLVPSIVDDYTGYRYYGAKELRKMFFILRLKDQGFKLEEIQELFEEGSYVSDFNRLEVYFHKCEQELEILTKRYNCLKALLKQEKYIEDSSVFYLENLPAIIVASHRMSISGEDEMKERLLNMFGPELLRLRCRLPYPLYCFSMETGKISEDGKIEIEYCEQVLDKGEDSEIIKFKKLPEFPMAACMKVYGPYHTHREKCKELYAEIAKRNYRIIGGTRFFYAVGDWNHRDSKKWLTIIQVPIEKV